MTPIERSALHAKRSNPVDDSFRAARTNVGLRATLAGLRGGLLLAVVLLAAGGCRTAMPPTSAPPSASAPVRLEQAPRTARELALPLAIWTERRDLPEPLAIHVLRIDLRCPTLEVIAMPAADAARTLAIVNRPSGGTPRPIPLMLGVRQRDAGSSSPSMGR